jgi:tryptophan synthase beta chain
MSNQSRFLLKESDLPKAWYNINADLPGEAPPVLHPGTHQPVTPDFLSVLFPMDLIMQEVSTERYIDIPQEVQEVYKLWRPTPLHRALRLEKALGTPAHIYFKNESVSPAGSHKPTTASGGLRWRCPASSSTWPWKSTWSRYPTTRNPTAVS